MIGYKVFIVNFAFFTTFASVSNDDFKQVNVARTEFISNKNTLNWYFRINILKLIF